MYVWVLVDVHGSIHRVFATFEAVERFLKSENTQYKCLPDNLAKTQYTVQCPIDGNTVYDIYQYPVDV